MRRLAGVAALAAGIGEAVVAIPRIRRQLRTVAVIDPQLRAPIVYLPFSFGPRTAALAGRMPAPPVGDLGGVRVSVVDIAPAAGLDGVAVRLYEPPARPDGRGAVLFVHGGGYVLGTAAQDDGFCAGLARSLGVLIVSVDYRLAPEHPFPAAHEDCLRALRWLHEASDELRIDPSLIVVSGESAGGGLAAGLVQRAVDEGLPVCFQHLVYPMLDDRTVTRAERDGEWNAVWTPRSNRYGWASYLGHEPGREDAPHYSVPARRASFSGLPPAWIGVGSADLFHEEGVAYAEALSSAGVRCELLVVPGMYHAAQRFAPHAPAAMAFERSMVDALAGALELSGVEEAR